jgi:hypothetical protein
MKITKVSVIVACLFSVNICAVNGGNQKIYATIRNRISKLEDRVSALEAKFNEIDPMSKNTLKSNPNAIQNTKTSPHDVNANSEDEMGIITTRNIDIEENFFTNPLDKVKSIKNLKKFQKSPTKPNTNKNYYKDCHVEYFEWPESDDDQWNF